MKLLVATPLYPPEPGGPATYAKILENELPKRGVEVVLVKFGEVRQYAKLVRHAAYFFKILRAAREARGVDLVLALDPVSVGLPAMLAARWLGKPFVVKVVGDYAWEQGSQRFGVAANLDEFVKMKKVPAPVAALRRVQTRVAGAATRVIVPSEYLKRIVTAWGIPAAKIEVIYNAMQPETLGKVPEAVARMPRPLVVSVGRLVPWKGMEGAIEAVNAIGKEVPGVSLAITGDGPERGRLEVAITKLGKHGVLTGQLSHADTLATIASADAFVLNTSYEGLSHLLIEALALGVPVVTTDVGGNPELVRDGENGLLVSANDPEALAAALARILTDGEVRARLGARAKESALRFSIEAMTTATAHALSELI